MLRRSPGSDKSLQETHAQQVEEEFQQQASSPYPKRRSTLHHHDLEATSGVSLSQSASSEFAADEDFHDTNNYNNSSFDHHQNQDDDDHDNKKIKNTTMFKAMFQYMNSTRLMVLVVLCLQNSLFTVLRRYSQGVLQEVYSKVGRSRNFV
ncbi:MAG: hypothetical protein SGILL_009569 [Bacillariaceae sp.]